MSEAQSPEREVLTPPPQPHIGTMGLLDALTKILTQLPGDGLPTRPEMSPNGVAHLTQALVGVMRRVRDVEKTGYNAEAKYRFVEWAVLSAKLQDALVNECLVLSQREVARSIVGKVLFIKYQVDAYWADPAGAKSEWIINLASGTGACRFQFKSGGTDDKAANKAMTAGVKQIATSLFKIPADVADIERDDVEVPQRRDGERERPADNGRDRQQADERGQGTGRPPDDRGTDQREPPPAPPDDGGPPNWDPPDSRGDDRRGPPEDAGRGRPPEDEAPPFKDPPYAPPGQPNPPLASPEDLDFRRNVKAFGQALTDARDLAEAARIWAENTELIQAMTDSTYEFFRQGYYRRWNMAPPPT